MREVGQSCCDGMALHYDVICSTARLTLCEVAGVRRG